MKCYIVTDPNAYEFGVTTVFAKTASKARYLSSFHEEMGDDTRDAWLHYSTRRFPEGDRFFKEGKNRLNWENMEERRVLIEHAGWCCDPNDEYSEEENGCALCTCKDICPKFEGRNS